MDDGINVRVYKVGRASKSHPLFIDQLDKIYSSGNQKRRTKDSYGVKVRLERFDASENVAIGEFVRLQEKGYPSEVHDDKVGPLATKQPLGHHIAFAFHKQKHVLALQYDLHALSLSRINQYLSKFPPHNMYLFTPLFRDDAWKAIEDHPPKKLKFAIAYPESLRGTTGKHKALYENISQMGSAMQTHLVEMSLSMGQPGGRLRDAVSFLKDLSRRGDAGEVDLRKLKATPDNQIDEINMIEQVLNEKITLDLPVNDPDKSYAMRVEALKAGLERNAKKFK